MNSGSLALAVICVVASVAFYALALWQARQPGTSARSVTGNKLAAGIAIYIAAAYVGFSFPAIEHGNTPWMGFPPVAFAAAVLIAIAEVVRVGFMLRIPRQWTLLIFFPVLVISATLCTTAHILLINGLGDRSRPLWHRVRVVDKKPSRRSPNSQLIVKDWVYPHGPLSLWVTDREYQQTKIGSQLEIETLPGALGIEWMRNVRFLETLPSEGR